MRKGIILYQSKYGATKQYALWLQEKTGFDCQEIRHTSFHQIILTRFAISMALTAAS